MSAGDSEERFVPCCLVAKYGMSPTVWRKKPREAGRERGSEGEGGREGGWGRQAGWELHIHAVVQCTVRRHRRKYESTHAGIATQYIIKVERCNALFLWIRRIER